MKKIKIILVGAGPRGINWLKVIKKSNYVELIGICDLNIRAKQKIKALHLNKIPFYTNFKKAVIEGQPDAALLSTSPFNRMRDIKICCKYKIAALVEKPLSIKIDEAKNIVNLMAKHNLLLMVGLNFRYLPVTKKLADFFISKKIGKPCYAKFIYERWRDGRLKHLNKYPLTMKHPMLWEQSIHHFDLMRFVYNSEVKSVYAITWNPSWSMYSHHTNVSALLSFNNGLTVNYLGTWQSNFKEFNFEWRTECEKGIIIQKKQFSDLFYINQNSKKLIKIQLKKFEMWKTDADLLLKDFSVSLVNKTKLHSSGKDHLKSLCIVQACIDSSKMGKKIVIK
jgi:predicted dehydrogenase